MSDSENHPTETDIRSRLRELSDRFGFDRRLFDAYHFVRKGSKYLMAHAIDHSPPVGIPESTGGIPFMRLNLKHPKLTTAATLLIGRHALRNVLELDHADALRFVRREYLELGRAVPAQCTGPGYVIVKWHHTPLGVGLLLDDPGGFRLKSLYPGRWAARGAAASTPDENGT